MIGLQSSHRRGRGIDSAFVLKKSSLVHSPTEHRLLDMTVKYIDVVCNFALAFP